MMDWEKQGGSAFPVDTHNDTPLHAETGMSLRDYFAGQALSAGVSTEAKDYELNTWFGPHAAGVTVAEIVAARVYEIADAMLARRRK